MTLHVRGTDGQSQCIVDFVNTQVPPNWEELYMLVKILSFYLKLLTWASSGTLAVVDFR